ncbi:hypothetical protein JCM33374_g3515 [Metschnikowia sp. JCM 33374]|nr:hypothetical protein JCM33374_g3515 [Metschnikowia sp. JCM 33374]
MPRLAKSAAPMATRGVKSINFGGMQETVHESADWPREKTLPRDLLVTGSQYNYCLTVCFILHAFMEVPSNMTKVPITAPIQTRNFPNRWFWSKVCFKQASKLFIRLLVPLNSRFKINLLMVID